MIAPAAITLGVLAGGRATRLGGRDKAWIAVQGTTMLEGCLAQFDDGFGGVLVSARTPDPRHAVLGVVPVFDRRGGFRGPVAALEALAHACTTPWLLTVPVDARDVPADLPRSLAVAAGEHGACVVDADGLQPLLALWRRDTLADAATAALDAGDAAARDLVERMALARVDLGPRRLRNLNTPDVVEEFRP